MALVRLFHTDIAAAVMDFLNESFTFIIKERLRGRDRFYPRAHSSLLETSKALRSCEAFAQAIASHVGFHLWKVAAPLRGEVLCRKAIVARPLPQLVATVPDQMLSIEFLAAACARNPLVCNIISRDILRDSCFTRAYTQQPAPIRPSFVQGYLRGVRSDVLPYPQPRRY